MTRDVYARAVQLIASDRWAEAARELAPSLAATPSTPLLALAAEVSLRFGAYAEACDLARQSAQHMTAPLDPIVAARIARLYRRLELSRELGRLFDSQTPVRWPPSLAAEMAILASSASLFDDAARIARELMHDAPQNADAHYVAGLLAMFDGERDRSLDHLRRALTIEPRMGNAHWLVAMQDDVDGASAHIDAMRRALAGVVPVSENAAYLHFSLHRRLHDLGLYREAWTALEAGWRVVRQIDPYDPDTDERLFAALRDVPMPAKVPSGTDGEPRLIFIVGMFRSGTTLIERVLTTHPDVVDGGETYQFTAAFREAADSDGRGPVDLELVRRAHAVHFDQVRVRFMNYARWRAAGRPVLTEKLPANFLNVPFILRALPSATIVHLRRDPIDTCFSNLRTYFRGAAPYSNSPVDMARYYCAYDALMAHWSEQAPGRLVEVDYSAFVANPAAESARLLEACGLAVAVSPHKTLSAPRSTTASAADVGKGILRNRGGAWRPYEHELVEMRNLLDGCL